MLIKSISGIRGTIGGIPGENLTPPDIVKFTTAYASWLKAGKSFSKEKKAKVVIGRDGRISGPVVSSIVSSTLASLGIDVIDLGLSTTPTVEVAVAAETADGGIIITASHNPKQWNALKLLNSKGEFISAADGARLLQFAEEGRAEYAGVQNMGSLRSDSTYIEKHIKMILSHPLVDAEAVRAKKFCVVADVVNSTGALALPPLFEALGVEKVILLNEEVHGDFAHNPEPLPDHLTELSKAIKKHKAHLGIAVDPDVDRLALVCEDGEMFGEEYTLVAVADYFLQHHKGGNTVSNLSSTRALRDVTEKHGGTYSASAVGEVNVVEMMKKTKAVIGGEGNGGIIVPDLHYGRDAMAGIALFLTHLAKYGKSASMLRATYPDYYISKNKIELTSAINLEEILAGIREKYKKQPANDIDGLKLEFGKEWVHLRKSNTEPIIRIYAEGESQTTADNLAAKILSDIKELVKNPVKS